MAVYKGTTMTIGGCLWADGSAGPDGNPYIAIMQPDGNFVVYKGNAPVAGQALWATNTSWNLDKVKLSNVIYDMTRAVTSVPQVQSEFTQVLTNDTDVEQDDNFTYECDYTESQSWSTTWRVKIGVQTTIKAGIPLLLNGNIQISAEGSWSTTSGSQQSQTKKYAGSLPVKVPPHSTVTCNALVSTSTISVPFSANANYWYNSGQSVVGTYAGVYQGAAAYEIQASWVPS